MIRKTFCGLIVLCFACSLLFSTEKNKEKDLSLKYQEWLKLVTYVVRPEEKDVFLQLANDRERDLFIETFWKQRDPTPGTPQNEYKEEHMRRFVHANRYYGRNTPREGWMTDMGRIYIILGEPTSVEIIETSGIYPAQVWTYYGDQAKGLPTQFNIVFFQRSGSGEYRMYNPISDGPAELIIEKQGLDLTNHRQLYEKVRELAPTLAGPSISLIPGQYPYDYTPSPRSDILIASVFESAQKEINPLYATHFLNYKGVVSTEYLTNYIESHTDVALIQDPIMNINFIHFSISPSRVSIDYFEPNDQYYCNYQLNVSVRKEEKLIFQYSKDFPFYFKPDNVEVIRGKGIAVQDSFPLIEGTYQISILIQNSVGKEFSVFDREVLIPEHSEVPRIIGPVLGYRLQDYPGHLHVPYRVVDKQLLVDPKGTVSPAENIAFFFSVMDISRGLWENGKVEIFLNGMRERAPSQKLIVLELKDYPFNEILGVNYSLPAKELSPDYYELKLVLKDERGVSLDEKVANTIISPSDEIAHPVTLAKSFPLSNYFLYIYSLANQYDRDNKLEKAESFYEKAYSLKPDYSPGVIEYAHFLQKVRQFDKSLNLIENVKDNENLRFEYYLVKGQAYMGMKKYFTALENFLEGNKIYNSDIRLLNSLGYCFYRTGDKQKALEALRASLRLSPDQEEVMTLIQKIEKDIE